ncbi:MAG TPA: MobA/MobL family protein [Methylocella sp.]|nr:MobA/MobL family protein [Methylocella sp.]
MSIFCLNIQNIRRGRGRSAVGAAAYCSRSRLHDERSAYIYDFTAAAESLVHSEVMLLEGPADECLDRAELWNASGAINERDNALLAWAIEAVIPGELRNEAGLSAAREFAEQELVRLGAAVDLSLHRALDAAGRPQMFAYLLVPAAGAEAGWIWPDRLAKWRKHWAQCVNQRVISAGSDALLDAGVRAARGRSLEFDVQVDGAAAIELSWWNGERIKAEPELVAQHLLQGRDAFTRDELASLVRQLTVGDAQFKEARHRVESLPGMVRLGRSEAGEDLFGFRGGAALRASQPAGEAKAAPEIQDYVAAGEIASGSDVLSPLRSSADEWVREGLRVRGVGLTYDLAKKFEKATGIPTAAVHGILGRWKKKKDLLEPGDVLVVNDVAQLSDRQKQWMLKAVRREKAKMAVVTGREFVLIDGKEVGLDERQSAALGWSAA